MLHRSRAILFYGEERKRRRSGATWRFRDEAIGQKRSRDRSVKVLKSYKDSLTAKRVGAILRPVLHGLRPVRSPPAGSRQRTRFPTPFATCENSMPSCEADGKAQRGYIRLDRQSRAAESPPAETIQACMLLISHAVFSSFCTIFFYLTVLPSSFGTVQAPIYCPSSRARYFGRFFRGLLSLARDASPPATRLLCSA